MSKIYPKGVVGQLKRLNALTTGPASLRMPAQVTDITVKFASEVSAGTEGVHALRKKFLPPIQFYNPKLAINVQRTSDGSSPSIKITFEDGSTKVLDASHEPAESLLDKLKEFTKAEFIPEAEQTRLGEDL